MRYGRDRPSLYVDIGQRIMMARRRALLSQHALGERLGVSHAAISDIERAKSKPNLDDLIAIADAIGVSLGQIVILPKSGRRTRPEEASEPHR